MSGPSKSQPQPSDEEIKEADKFFEENLLVTRRKVEKDCFEVDDSWALSASRKYLLALKNWMLPTKSTALVIHNEPEKDVARGILYLATKSSYHNSAFHVIGSTFRNGSMKPRLIMGSTIAQVVVNRENMKPGEILEIYRAVCDSDVLGCLRIFRRLLERLGKGCVFVIDDFSNQYSDDDDKSTDFWRGLFWILGCGEAVEDIEPCSSICKVLIRNEGDNSELENLGYHGEYESDPNGLGGGRIASETAEWLLECSFESLLSS